RHATQVTPHDQLVAIVREVASPTALDMVDQNRPAKFEIDSNGLRYEIAVAPKPGAWQVTIGPADPTRSPPPPSTPPPQAARPVRSSAPMPTVADSDMPIERGQYAQVAGLASSSGSAVLDMLTNAA